MTEPDRREAVEDLVFLRRPVAEAASRLRSFPWDSDSELVVLSDRDVRRVLDAFLDEQLDADEVATWAGGIESRDDIGFEEGRADALKDLLFAVATPELTGRLTTDQAIRWKTTFAS